MLKILYANVGKEWPRDRLRTYLDQIPVSMQEKSMRFRRWQDRQTYIGGKLLLIQGLEAFGEPKRRLHEIEYNEFDRPSIKGKLDFNISHSGDYVCCALSDEYMLGIDIEEVKPIELSDFAYIWTEKETQKIAEAQDAYVSFFWLWTCKEAVIKADGRGLNIPLKEILIEATGSLIGEQFWYLTKLEMPTKYMGHLATEVELPAPPKMQKVVL